MNNNDKWAVFMFVIALFIQNNAVVNEDVIFVIISWMFIIITYLVWRNS